MYKKLLKENIEKISYYIKISDTYNQELAGTIDLNTGKIFCVSIGTNNQVHIPEYLNDNENIWHTHSNVGKNLNIYYSLTPYDIYEGLYKLIYLNKKNIFEIIIHNEAIIICEFKLEKHIILEENDYQIEMELVKFQKEYNQLLITLYLKYFEDNDNLSPYLVQKKIFENSKIINELNILLNKKLSEYHFLKNTKIEMDIIYLI